MYKHILTFLLAALLCACATGRVRQIPSVVRSFQRVNFWADGHKLAAFKVVGSLEDSALEGVLQIKKIGEEDFDVQLLTVGGYRVLHATVTPEGIAYRFLFPEVDTSLVRGRITQFLNLLVGPVGTYERFRVKKEVTTVVYKGPSATHKLMYRSGQIYPFAAQTATTFNTADLSYEEYAPSSADGERQVPHLLIYKDGKITLEMALISLR